MDAAEGWNHTGVLFPPPVVPLQTRCLSPSFYTSTSRSGSASERLRSQFSRSRRSDRRKQETKRTQLPVQNATHRLMIESVLIHVVHGDSLHLLPDYFGSKTDSVNIEHTELFRS